MIIKASKNEKMAGIGEKQILTAAKESSTYSYRHLYVGSTKSNVFYLGYPLSLTDTEFAILRILTLCCGNTLSPTEILHRCALSSSVRSVSLHIHNINRKAREIGGRNLVKNHKNKGYFLNDEM